MYLQKISLASFKNYHQAGFVFSDKINCFVGNNGVGKTNLLDAIHYLSFCKSFFSSLDAQNIHHGDEFFTIQGIFNRGTDVTELIQCIQKKNQRKRFLINKKEYDRLADHIGNFPLVMISPYDRDLINDGSELRRKYIDSVISQFDKFYLDDLIQYNRVLAQRNALLRSFADQHYFDSGALEIWDEQMIRLGNNVLLKRKKFLEQFIPVFQQYFSLIGGDAETVQIRYISQLEEHTYREQFKAALPADRSAQFSTVGIHKDDLEFLLGGFPIKRFGSQGQQKSFVIAIKLAQFEYTRTIKGFKPILLLDDVFDKLDDLRVAQLIKLVSEHSFGQVFITDTSESRIRTIFDAMDIDHKIFCLPVLSPEE
ncbi:MAG: DNA replication/repair protein RecF [Bacteroidales bacterium]|jgi:DNA replication and repair protein RecF|nr:DNA replication/repair protein RecF [Bacteroidales bacterium]